MIDNFDVGVRVIVRDPILYSFIKLAYPNITMPMSGKVVRRVGNIHYVLIDGATNREEIVPRIYLERE